MLNLQPYADPTYFVYLLIALVPLAIGLYFGKRFNWYEVLVSVLFLFLMLDGKDYKQGFALIGYAIWQVLVVAGYTAYRKRANASWVFYLTSLLSLLPLILHHIIGFLVHGQPGLSLVSFIGLSYVTFRSVSLIIETRDGSIKDFNLMHFLRFMLFMPTISSGPIDRYKRFTADITSVPDREKYIGMLEKAVKYFFLGFLYQFILDHYFSMANTYVQNQALNHAHNGFSWWLFAVAYMYGLHLFFNFAGYSLFAVATSYVMGIEAPMNFKQPFRAHNLKDFWNRWHITLSFWFRDYIFMRFVFMMMKKKVIKNRITISNIAYVLNMFIMGLWHGLTWYYIVYGLFHGVGLMVNDMWLRFKKKHRDKIPHNKFTEWFAVFLTFNVVMFSFLIFCGFLNKFWFNGSMQ
ncbi:D-alanyl-lipoteichoic acid biosynthesis protein DltB [Eupransor demetentiae]|uniref:Teichoic acid D-alanyltransferase n=1 Tax=Eupransor demetentiae TaxID=3109584 RepID=A0ABM9N5T1_9LACO|nr:D-alanyl-lipoteichoic acid acyltransferase DltB [Lactobacillaceae bacterium LMG 33000]